MTLSQIQYFLTLYEEKSVTIASQIAYVSQPTISRSIRDLEHEYGVTLFVRKKNQMIPTEEAAYLYKKLLPIYQDYQSIDADMRNHSIGRETVSIAIGDQCVDQLFPMFSGFMGNNPDVMLTMTSTSRVFSLKLLNSEKIDIYACGRSSLHMIDSSEYEYCEIMKFPLGAIVGLNHPLAERKVITLEELARYPMAFLNPLLDNDMRPNSAVYIPKMFKNHGINPKVVLYSDQGAIIKQMVANGRCASFEALRVPKGTGDSRIVRIPFSPEWQVTIVFVWKKNIELSRAAKKFIEFARNYDYSSIEYEA